MSQAMDAQPPPRGPTAIRMNAPQSYMRSMAFIGPSHGTAVEVGPHGDVTMDDVYFSDIDVAVDNAGKVRGSRLTISPDLSLGSDKASDGLAGAASASPGSRSRLLAVQHGFWRRRGLLVGDCSAALRKLTPSAGDVAVNEVQPVAGNARKRVKAVASRADQRQLRCRRRCSCLPLRQMRAATCSSA